MSTNFWRTVWQAAVVLLLSIFIAYFCVFLAIKLLAFWRASSAPPDQLPTAADGWGLFMAILLGSFCLSALGFWRYREWLLRLPVLTPVFLILILALSVFLY